MAGGQATSILTPRQVAVVMVRFKSQGIRKALGDGLLKTPGAAQAAIQKLTKEKPRLQRWMTAAGINNQELERIIRHGK